MAGDVDYNGKDRLLEFLKGMDQSNVSVPKELAEILDMSLESVYRRLRGEVEFTFSEVIRIAERFSISLDVLISQQKGTFATVHYNQMYNQRSVFVSYLANVNAMLKKVHEDKGRVLYISNNLPISHSFRNSPLRDFKVYYWQRVVLNRERYRSVNFSTEFALTDAVNHSINTMLDYYDRIDTSEIWNENSLDSTIRQINYCKRLGLFKDDKILESLYDSVRDTLNALENKLASATKGEGIEFYVCSIELASTCVQMYMRDRYLTFLNFSIFNSVSTSNIGIGEEVNAWRDCLLNKSTQIAGESELTRHNFFNVLRKKLDTIS